MNIGKEIALLKGMTVAQLRDKYAAIFGEPTRNRHKEYLVKRIIWRMQSLSEGTLSERAKRRAEELANNADIRMHAPKKPIDIAPERTRVGELHIPQNSRLPMPGTALARQYKGKMIVATVLTNGSEYDGKVYRSLSAVAKAVTGTHWNGYHFFRLNNGGEDNV